MKLTVSPSLKRSLGYSAITLFVLIVFLLGYFYYFIPVNKEVIHKNGFLILRGIAENIQYRNESHLSLFTNFYKNANSYSNANNNDTVQKFLRQNNIQATFKFLSPPAQRNKKITRGKESVLDSNEPLLSRMEIEKRNLKYVIKDTSRPDTLVVFESFRNFLEPILISQRAELFKSYAVVRINGKESQLLFQDSDLGMRSDFVIDSLLPRTMQAYVSGIRDFNSPEFNHLMFYYPFEIDDQQLLLCGFIKTDKYILQLRNMPFYFVYPLVILFLLLLFFMPILKFYIMDSNERLGTRGLGLFGLSVFGSATLITLVLIHFLLWKGDELRARSNLHKLADQIEKGFLQELENTYDQLQILDSLRQLDTSIRLQQKVYEDYSERMLGMLKNFNTDTTEQIINNLTRDSIKKVIGAVNPDIKFLRPFERISWIDNLGMQRIKADIYAKPLFTDVSDRQYFQVWKNDDALLIPGTSKKLGWEPLYSWTNADFNITISMQADSLVAALAVKMNSLYRVLMPVGYGFCLIDKEGNVQLHSDINRNLRENFFEKADPSDKIRGMVAARKEWDFNDVMMYGKRNLMHIHPVKELPYYLVIFHDKGYIVPINMRILIFSLVCCIFSTFTCVLLWVALGRVGFWSHPFVYSTMDCMSWLRPKKDEIGYYSHACFFLVMYGALLLLCVFLHRPLDISSYTIFSLVALTPLNIVLLLFIMRAALVNFTGAPGASKERKIRPRLLLIAGAHLLISILFYVYSVKAAYPLNAAFLFFQIVFNAWMWIYLLSKKNTGLMSRKASSGYLTSYNWMATWLVICIAVIPSGLYTWYAHNHEIPQAIKKQQLHLFNGINKRSDYIIQKTSSGGIALLPYTIIDSLLYREGIYTIYKDSIFLRNDSAKGKQQSAVFDPFYFEVAETVSNRYYDPELYPALEGAAADNIWSWEEEDGKVHFSYRLRSAGSTREDQSIHIVSTIPERFIFLSSWNKIIWLLVLIGLLVWALYQWLRITTSNVFLIKYVQKDSPANDPGEIISEYYKQPGKAADAENPLLNEAIYEKYVYTTNRIALDRYEKEILEQLQAKTPLYDFVWSKMSDKEKYLLLDFAQDGLINYKNPIEIYKLISKDILRVKNKKMRLFEPGFRAYILTKLETDEVQKLHTKFQHNSAWRSARGPLLLLGLGFLTLIFFTQEDIFQKVLGLATGAATLITIIPKLFLSGQSKVPEVTENKA